MAVNDKPRMSAARLEELREQCEADLEVAREWQLHEWIKTLTYRLKTLDRIEEAIDRRDR